MNTARRSRRSVNHYVAATSTLAIIGMLLVVLTLAHITISNAVSGIDGWGLVVAIVLTIVGLIGAALAGLTTARRS